MPLNKQSPPEVKILNSGLNFAMEFGENWLQAIHQRLLSKYDFLTKKQLEEYNLICTEAMKVGQEFIYNSLVQVSDRREIIKENQLKENFKTSS